MIVPIPNHDGYFADDEGNIYSNKAKGNSIRKLNPTKVGKTKSKKHLRVTINGKNAFVHRLVYLAFHGEIPEGKIVCHKDDNAENNRPKNLYAGNHSSNAIDGFKNGRNKSVKITQKIADEIFSLKGKMRNKDVAEKYNISKCSVSDIWNGRTWKRSVLND